MGRLEGLTAILLGTAWLAGCATSALDMAPPAPDHPWVPATTPQGEIIAGQRGSGSEPGGYVLPADPELATLSAPPAVESAKIYSLAELIDLAEMTNPSTRIAWNDARRIALAAGIARSNYLPNLTASVIGGYQGSSGHDSGASTAFGDGSASGTVAAVSLQWLLFDFGERGAVLDAAKQASVISNIAFTAIHQQVIYDVTEAFYAYSAAQTRLATASQSLKNAAAVQVAAENRRRQGIGTVIEVDQARQGTAQVNLALVQANGGVEDAYLTLITAMGVSPLTKIHVAEVAGRHLPVVTPAPVETLIAEALARRPDVQSAFAAEQASLANIRAAQAEFMPKVFVTASGTHTSGGLAVTALPTVGQQAPTLNVSGSRFGGSIFAGVTVPLYDGGMRAAVLAQARAEADNAEARSTLVKESAARQIVVADNALRTSLAANAAAEALATAAQTTFDAALAAYSNGVGSITDVTLAETQLLLAKNALSDAYSTALAAAATLGLATGVLGAAPP